MTDINTAGNWNVHRSLPAGAGFVGSLLILLGLMNMLHGIAAVADSGFLAQSPRLMVGTVFSWGVAILVIAAVQLACAVGVFMQTTWARWLAIAIIGADTIAQMIALPEYPFWSLVIIGVNLFALYALFTRYTGMVETVSAGRGSAMATPYDISRMPFPR